METATVEIPKSSIPETSLELEFKTIGPTFARNKLIGVRYDLKSGKYISYTTQKRTGGTQMIGLYSSEKQAAIAHDMQALKIYGLLADDYLNYNYLYEEGDGNCKDNNSEKEAEALNHKIRVKYPSGIMITIECDRNQQLMHSSEAEKISPLNVVEANAVAVVAETEIKTKVEVVDNLVCSPYGVALILPGKADMTRRWSERLARSYHPTAAFAFEVTFTFQSSLGLQLRPFLLTYSVAGGKRILGCCVVIDSSNSPTQIVQAGDILLSINGMSLIGTTPHPQVDAEVKAGSSSEFNFDASVKAISQATTPRTIRFLRYQ
jgi:hypothetical protein